MDKKKYNCDHVIGVYVYNFDDIHSLRKSTVDAWESLGFDDVQKEILEICEKFDYCPKCGQKLVTEPTKQKEKTDED